jgi:hypothetical protein
MMHNNLEGQYNRRKPQSLDDKAYLRIVEKVRVLYEQTKQIYL